MRWWSICRRTPGSMPNWSCAATAGCLKELSPASNDDRTLGVQVRLVKMRAQDAPPKVFDANAGDWLEEQPAPSEAKP